MAKAEPHHWLIAGVGRSGTTAVYEGLQNCTHQFGQRFKFFYEPYLWGPPTWQDPFRDAAGAFASTGAMDPRGLRTHLAVPLFIAPGAPRHPAHEVFVNRVFPDATNSLTKIIRGCGRLRDYLVMKPSLKVIYLIRNPLDCVNSVLEHFSYYGDEFHPSDKTRFTQELNLAPRSLHASESALAGLWWNEMNKAALNALAEFPDRSLVVPYEAFRMDPQGSFSNIIRFLGVAADVQKIHLGRPAGPVSSDIMLHSDDVSKLISHHKWYFSNIEEISTIDNPPPLRGLAHEIRGRYDGAPPGVFRPDIPRDLSPTRIRSILSTQMGLSNLQRGKYQRPLAIRRPQLGDGSSEDGTDSTSAVNAAQARSQPAHAGPRREGTLDQASSETALAISPDNPYLARLATESAMALRVAADAHRAAVADIRREVRTDVEWVRNEPRIACVITSFNNGPALRRAVESVLAQALPPTEVLIADDCSGAASREVAISLQDEERNIKVLPRERNLGPGLNRDLAIRELSSPFFTTLDGDDEFGPLKLSAEWRALGECTECVSFSDMVIIKPQRAPQVVSTLEFSQLPDKVGRFDVLLNRTQWLPHNMLYGRELYLRSGGYDCQAYMYEDWSLKIRLAREVRSWRHAAVIGLIYNRHGHGLSNADGILHCFWKLHAIQNNLSLVRGNLPSTRIIDALIISLKAHSDEQWRTEAMAAVEDAIMAVGPTAILERLGTMKIDDDSRLAPSSVLQRWLTDWVAQIQGMVTSERQYEACSS